MRQNVFAGAGGHFQRVRAQKVTRKNAFAGAAAKLGSFQVQKVTHKNVFAGARGRFQRVRASKMTCKNVFSGAGGHFSARPGAKSCAKMCSLAPGATFSPSTLAPACWQHHDFKDTLVLWCINAHKVGGVASYGNKDPTPNSVRQLHPNLTGPLPHEGSICAPHNTLVHSY